MGYDDLIKKVQRIREARVDARAAAESKPARASRPKKEKDPMDKIFASMSPEERQKFMEMLEKKT